MINLVKRIKDMFNPQGIDMGKPIPPFIECPKCKERIKYPVPKKCPKCGETLFPNT